MAAKKPFWVEMGGSVVEEGITYHRYTVMGPAGEVLRGARAGKEAEVKKYAQKFADKLAATAGKQRFEIRAAA